MRFRPRPRSTWLLILVGLAAAFVGSCRTAPERPDVVVIVIDTLRPDYLGFYGYEHETAPFMAGLAERSTVLRRAYATASWTAPSTASLFTSWHPTRHGVTDGFFAHKGRARKIAAEGQAPMPLNRLPTQHPTLPELFRDHGYRTFGLASNINIGQEIGFNRGFDRFKRGRKTSVTELGQTLDGWLDEDDDSQPRFIYLHLNDVHQPYEIRRPWYQAQADRREDMKARYHSEISFVDDALQSLFERHGWADGDTIVAIVSDHGEEFGEHGGYGHRFRLYRELVQTLAMIHAPAHGVIAQEVAGSVSLLDVLPTLAELTGLEASPEWEGLSLVDLLKGEGDPELHERPFFLHRMRNRGSGPEEMWSVIHHDWQLIDGMSRLELYDLAKDPAQQSDLAAGQQAVVSELSTKLAEFRARTYADAGHSTIDVPIDEEQLRALESLGYVQ